MQNPKTDTIIKALKCMSKFVLEQLHGVASQVTYPQAELKKKDSWVTTKL